jgi:hypothetical protein
MWVLACVVRASWRPTVQLLLHHPRLRAGAVHLSQGLSELLNLVAGFGGIVLARSPGEEDELAALSRVVMLSQVGPRGRGACAGAPACLPCAGPGRGAVGLLAGRGRPAPRPRAAPRRGRC